MHIKIMFQSVLYVAVCIAVNQVASQHSEPNYKYEERIETLANQIEGVVVSEAMKIALEKDAMQETLNEAVESIENQLVELHEIADAIRRRNRDRFCLRTIAMINKISLDPLKACNYSSRFDALNQIVDDAAELYGTLKNVTQTCESLILQDSCEDQLLEGIENYISELPQSISESIEQISNSYLGCIQEALAGIDKTLSDIGHQVQQCV